MLQDPDINNSLGVAKFSKKEKGVYCKFYFKRGKIYSVFSTETFPDFVTRLYQSGDLSNNNLEIIKTRFRNDLKNPQIQDFIVDRHMVSLEALENVKQDFFLDIFERIISWDNVNADWISNETTDYVKIIPVDYQRIIELLLKRKELIETIASDFGVQCEDLSVIKFDAKTQENFNTDTPLIYFQLYSLANGEVTTVEAAAQFGLTEFRTLQTLHLLWQNDNINVYFKGKHIEPALRTVEPSKSNNQEIETETDPNVPTAIVSSTYKNIQEHIPKKYVPFSVNKAEHVEDFIEVNTEHDDITKNDVVIDLSEGEFADNKNNEQTDETESQQRGNVDLILPTIEDSEGETIGRIKTDKSVSKKDTINEKPHFEEEPKSDYVSPNKNKLEDLEAKKTVLTDMLQNQTDSFESVITSDPTEINIDPHENDNFVSALTEYAKDNGSDFEHYKLDSNTTIGEVYMPDNINNDSDNELSDLIEKIHTQLNQKKNTISELEKDITDEEEVIQRKREQLTTLKNDYDKTVEKLKIFNI